MDPENPVSRMERTLWTFWYYVTEAVNRFLRPEPTDIISNDPNSTQEPAVESEPANHAEGEASGRRVDEDQSLATASLLNPSRAAIAWELCTADIDLGPDEESIQCEAQLSRGSESKVSEEGEDTIEEHFTQKESSDAGLPIAKDAKEDEQEENGDRRLYTHGQNEMLENDEYEEYVSTRPLRLTGEAMSEEMEKIDGAGDEETESAMTPDDHQKRDENIGNIQVKEEDDKMHHIDEQDLVAEDIEVKLYTISDLSLEEDDMHIEEAKLQRDEADTEVMHDEVQSSDGVLLLASENENKSDGGARQVENQFSVCEELSDDDQDLKGDPGFTSLQAQLQMLHNKGGIEPEDELTVVEREHVMAHRSESDKAEDAKEEEDESTLDEREQGAAIGEENGNEAEKNQTADEVLEQEDTETVTEGREEEDILTCRGKIGQNAETELHTDEFTHVEEEEDVAKDTEVQTKTRETDDVETENSDVTTTEISGDGRFFDECQVEEERLSSDIGKKKSYMEIACTTTTVEPEGETGQEIIGEFQNIPHGKCEGRLVVLQELNYPAYEETQEGVPECNNETGPDENTTQWFLEVGVYKETQTTQLPEEVERKEPESLQNSGADHSLVMEHMEEEQDSTEDIKNSFDLVVEEHAGIPRLTDAELPQETEKPLVKPVIQESGLFFEAEEKKLSVDSVKTGVEHSEKKFETEVTLRDEADKTTKELQAAENENKSEEGARQVENQLSVCEELSDDNQDLKGDPGFTSLQAQLQMLHNKVGVVPEDELTVVGQEHVMAHRSESDKAEDAKEEEDESTLDEREQGAAIGEENGNEAEKNQTADEVLEQEDTETVTEGREEEDILTCRGKIGQNAETELHTDEFTHGEKEEDVAKDTEVQTKTRETDDLETENSDVTTTEISGDGRFFDKFETEVGLRDEADKTTKELQAAENENKSEEGARQVENQLSVCEELSDDDQDLKGDPGFTSLQAQLQILHNKVGVVPEDELTVVGQEHVMAHRSESDKAEDAKEEEDESTLDEREQGAAIGEENGNEAEKNQTADEVLEQEDTETVTEGREEEDILTCRGKIGQNAETELHTDEFTYGEKEEDVAKDTEVQTKTRETDDLETENSDVTTTEISGDGRFFDECQVEEERLSSDIGKKEETEKPLVEPVIQESGLFFEEEEEKLSVDSMKTGVEHSEKEFETEFGLRDEADKTTKELQDGTEELLVKFEIDEGLCYSKEAEAAAGHETTGAAATEVQRMTETNFFQESVDAINSEQNSNMTLSLLDDITESGFQKQSEGSEPNLLEESAVEMQDAGIDMEETGYAVEEDAAEMLNLQVTGMAAELTTGRNEKENSLIAESELYRAVESLETRNLILDKTLEISNDEVLTDVEVTHVSTTTESKQKDLTRISTDDMANVTESEGSHAEETVSSISGRQDVIDEEILDLWLQTALPEDTDGIKQQEVSRQRIDMGIEPSNEEQDGISSVQTEKDKELLVESCSEKSEVVSDTDMSSSTVESGFLDQSLSEWGTQNNETQLLKSTSTGSFQGIYDLLANMSESADISELSKQQVNSGSQDSLMEETAATGQSNVLHPDSRVTSEAKHPNQELDKSQERVETVETETGSRKEINAEITDLARDDAWKDTEKADVKSLTEMSAPFKDEPLEITPCDSPDEIKHTETGQTISGSETSSVEGNVFTESVSQGDTYTNSEKLLKLPSLDKPQPGWSEDIADSFPGLNRAGVPTTESENQMEVDASVLDFTAQRSRIAVKNRRVRPPKDPRSLLHMPSADPTPSSHLPVKVPPGVPLGGLGIGIKLPGFGAGFPVLKKTRQVARDENSQETLPQEPETKPEEKSDTPKQEEAQHKPKWMPPRHPGFGNPLMSELKTKLKKTTKE